jgi:hypothetical protein
MKGIIAWIPNHLHIRSLIPVSKIKWRALKHPPTRETKGSAVGAGFSPRYVAHAQKRKRRQEGATQKKTPERGKEVPFRR